jgi:hypothetical protein
MLVKRKERITSFSFFFWWLEESGEFLSPLQTLRTCRWRRVGIASLRRWRINRITRGKLKTLTADEIAWKVPYETVNKWFRIQLFPQLKVLLFSLPGGDESKQHHISINLWSIQSKLDHLWACTINQLSTICSSHSIQKPPNIWLQGPTVHYRHRKQETSLSLRRQQFNLDELPWTEIGQSG